MKKVILAVLVIGTMFFFLNSADPKGKKYQDKRVMFINSYHEGYDWSDGEISGAQSVLRDAGIDLKIIHMDTKNNPGEDFKVKAGLEAKKQIEEYKPDVLIAADDNAFKYVVMPYYRDGDLPVVFCGINWDVGAYGGPYVNTTGMLEIALIKNICRHLTKFSKGKRVGVLGADFLGERKYVEFSSLHIEGGYTSTELIFDFESWKKKFLELQKNVDMIFLLSSAGIKEWNDEEAEKFVLENIKIPTGSDLPQMMPLSLVGVSKIPQEQGEYAAYCVLRILDGEIPADIPIVTNKKGNLYINLIVAEKLGVIFSPPMLRNAEIIYGTKE